LTSGDKCEVFCYDKEKVNRVRKSIDAEKTDIMAAMFKALADNTRAKIAFALFLENELCVCDVANIIDSTSATASHHLRSLHKMGLAKFRREGKFAFYSLDDDHINQLIEVAYAHSLEEDKIEKNN